MARADFFEARTVHGPEPLASPVTVTDPEAHTKNEAQPAQSPFFYHIKLKGKSAGTS